MPRDLADLILLYLYAEYQKDADSQTEYEALRKHASSLQRYSGNFDAALETLKSRGWILDHLGKCSLTGRGIAHAEKISKASQDGSWVVGLIILIVIIAVLSSDGSNPIQQTPAVIATASLEPNVPPVQTCQIAVGERVVALISSTIRYTEGYINKTEEDVCGYLASGDTATVIGGPSFKDNLTWWEIRVRSGTTKCEKGWVAEHRWNGQRMLECRK